MPPWILIRVRHEALVVTLGLAACTGNEGPGVASCPQATEACECSGTGSQCPGDSSTASASTDTSSASGSAAATDSGPDGGSTTEVGPAPPPFSVLPPLGVLGARWVYSVEQDGEEPYESVCEVVDTFAWPDGTPGSTLSCSSNGGATSRETLFALYDDRVERRDVIDYAEYDPPAPLYLVPLEVGDAWDVSWSHTFVVTTQLSEEWTVRAAGPIEVPAGTFDAIELGLVLSVDGEVTEVTQWWADGVGRVASEEQAIRSELVELHVP